MNNADLIVQMLEDAGVRWAFGVPSGPVLPLIEAMRRGSIEWVLTASETTAAYMATIVGDLTGVPGLCVSTLGPGATNLATGVGGAFLDRCPVIAITCNVATPWLDRRIQMRIDHHALFQPITKASLALREHSVASTVADALRLALSEPPGPVHLDLPEDVALAEAGESTMHVQPQAAPAASIAEALAQLAKAISGSRRSLLVVGLGFTRCLDSAALLSFIERQKMPFVTTAHAKGFLPESHPQWAGVIGRARRSDVQKLTDQADLIVAVGYDPVEINYEEWVGRTPVFHLSTEAVDTGPDFAPLFNLPVDLDLALTGLAELPSMANSWLARDLASHREAFERALRPAVRGFALHELLDVLRARLPGDGILAYDVGAHHHVIASQWRTDLPHTCLSTNGWSSMGIAMPAAYAAKLVHPDRDVVAVLGDGCFHMTAGELNVARRLRLAVPHIVLNDGWLSLIRLKQDRRQFGHSGVFLGEPPESPPHYFGVPCRAAQDRKTFKAALDWGLTIDGPSVVEVTIDGSSFDDTVYD